jgi:HTH-type transcriptional regulator / antitoxin HigA
MPATAVPRDYLNLIRRFLLRPIRSDEELDRAVEVSLDLDSRGDLSPDEKAYHDVLVALIERYEDEHHPIPDVSGADMLRVLIENRGATQVDVARGTGIKESALSEILRGKRPMGRKVIDSLARYFRVAPALFLPGEADPRSQAPDAPS